MVGMLSEREREIVDILAQDSNASVTDLSRQLRVSAVTVRNDLNNLVEKGLILRTRGGAASALHPEILRRQRHRVEAKHRIARAAAELVQDGDAIMIEAGTTTALLAQYLLGKRDLQIVTNSALVLPYLRINPAVRLTVVGGEFRPATESFVGPLALAALEHFHVRLAFVGTDGFTAECGLSTHLLEGAEIVRRMAARATQTILLADASKYGRRGFVQVLPLVSIRTLVTDTDLPVQAREEIDSAGVEVVVV
jgi:DeoR family transcriptional regulator, galactitol utilization operon repressor